MRFIKLIFLAALLVVVVGGVGGWFLAGREAGPSITISSPQKYVGRSTPFAAAVEAGTPVTAPEVAIEQGGQTMPVTPEKVDWAGTGRGGGKRHDWKIGTAGAGEWSRAVDRDGEA